MSRRYPAGFIFPGYDPLEVPNAPTIGTATAGDEELSVTFTAPADTGGGAITAYNAVAITGGATVATGTNTASPVTITGLTNGTAYTARVWAISAFGPSPLSAASGSVSPAAPTGLFALGFAGGASNVINSITITSAGNATDFGDLNVARYALAGCASSSRGLFGGGNTGSVSNVIDYVTFASAGNATDFGDLTEARFELASCASSVRGVFCGGNNSADPIVNIIDYVIIASTGNATDFGDLNNGPRARNAGCSSPTRGLFGGGRSTSSNDSTSAEIFYITIATTGNSTTFGNLTTGRYYLAACSSNVRGVFGGGQDSSGGATNIIDYVTIASTGNATDFGDLIANTSRLSACSSNIRGVFAGGGPTNVIQYVTIASAGNSTDFGDLTAVSNDSAACSNAHGGL